MNNSIENTFDSERKECKDIYEVLSHVAIFNTLMTCVFPEPEDKYLTEQKERVNRLGILKDKEILKQILDYFKDENNLAKFAEEVDKFYLEHKEALIRVWIIDSHKNIYSIAIATIKAFNKDIAIKNQDKLLLNVSIETWDIVENLNNKLFFILGQQKQNALKRKKYENLEKSDIIWDSRWNLLYETESGLMIDFNGMKIARVAWRYIDADTRKPILVNFEWIEWELIRVGGWEKKLITWEKITYFEVKKKDGYIQSFYLSGTIADITSNSTILRDSKNRIIKDFNGTEKRD